MVKKFLEDLCIGAFGNRISVLGFSVYSMSWASFSFNIKESPSLTILSLAGLLVGSSLLGGSGLGIGTYRHYKKTCKYLEETGNLDEEFVRKIIDRSENREFVGYCQLQGVYLAAKKHRQLESFFRYKRKYSNNLLVNF